MMHSKRDIYVIFLVKLELFSVTSKYHTNANVTK